jgi:hypothetical protein
MKLFEEKRKYCRHVLNESGNHPYFIRIIIWIQKTTFKFKGLVKRHCLLEWLKFTHKNMYKIKCTTHLCLGRNFLDTHHALFLGGIVTGRVTLRHWVNTFTGMCLTGWMLIFQTNWLARNGCWSPTDRQHHQTWQPWICPEFCKRHGVCQEAYGCSTLKQDIMEEFASIPLEICQRHVRVSERDTNSVFNMVVTSLKHF